MRLFDHHRSYLENVRSIASDGEVVDSPPDCLTVSLILCLQSLLIHVTLSVGLSVFVPNPRHRRFAWMMTNAFVNTTHICRWMSSVKILLEHWRVPRKGLAPAVEWLEEG